MFNTRFVNQTSAYDSPLCRPQVGRTRNSGVRLMKTGENEPLLFRRGSLDKDITNTFVRRCGVLNTIKTSISLISTCLPRCARRIGFRPCQIGRGSDLAGGKRPKMLCLEQGRLVCFIGFSFSSLSPGRRNSSRLRRSASLRLSPIITKKPERLGASARPSAQPHESEQLLVKLREGLAINAALVVPCPGFFCLRSSQTFAHIRPKEKPPEGGLSNFRRIVFRPSETSAWWLCGDRP